MGFDGFNFVMWIRPQQPLPAAQGEMSLLDKVLCFDLYEFEVWQAAGRVRDLRGLYTRTKHIEELGESVPEVVAPCTVFLRPSEKTLSPEETREVSEVGAILYEYWRQGDGNEAVLRALGELDRQLVEGGQVTLDAATQAPPLAWKNPDPYAEAEAADLEIFANPPHQLTDESWERLVKRMNLPDSSLDKDD